MTIFVIVMVSPEISLQTQADVMCTYPKRRVNPLKELKNKTQLSPHLKNTKGIYFLICLTRTSNYT